MTDRETAISILTRVAAELVRGDGLPNPEIEAFVVVRRNDMRHIVREMHFRGMSIANAIELLRKDAK